MEQPTSGPRCCEVCGRPLRADNKTGLCGTRKSPQCRKARMERLKKAHRTRPPHRIAISAGDTFGLLTALEAYSLDNRHILCRCVCGTEKRILGAYLVRGLISCGCAKRRTRPAKKPYLTTGQAFARLTVLEDARSCDDDARCRCECGTEITTRAARVKLGQTKSCGCLKRDRHTTHGFCGHPLYALWNGILDRCTDPEHPSWFNYGGRGITVCDRWLDPWAFAEDVERDLGPKPAGWSLDRIDNELGYFPGNVRWADRKTQKINQRTLRKLTRERDEARRERDALAAEVDRLTALLASRKRRTAEPASGIALF
jgi:hypothetical protein